MELIEVVADGSSANTALAIGEKHTTHDFRLGLKGEDGVQVMHLLVTDDKVQAVIDTLQNVLGAQP